MCFELSNFGWYVYYMRSNHHLIRELLNENSMRITDMENCKLQLNKAEMSMLWDERILSLQYRSLYTTFTEHIYCFDLRERSLLSFCWSREVNNIVERVLCDLQRANATKMPRKCQEEYRLYSNVLFTCGEATLSAVVSFDGSRD